MFAFLNETFQHSAVYLWESVDYIEVDEIIEATCKLRKQIHEDSKPEEDKPPAIDEAKFKETLKKHNLKPAIT